MFQQSNFKMKIIILALGISLSIVHLISANIPCICDPDEKICGSNGKTYESNCLLTCEVDQNNFNETALYFNETKLSCLIKVYDGPCTSDTCICSNDCDHYICGSNGKTYGSKCSFDCAQKHNTNLTKVKDGECGRCNCSDTSEPLCGSDSWSYNNKCEFNCQKEIDLDLTIVNNGSCILT